MEAALGILRIEESDIVGLDNTLGVDERHLSKGIVRNEDRLIILLDYDKIIAEIQPDLLSEEELKQIMEQ